MNLTTDWMMLFLRRDPPLYGLVAGQKQSQTVLRLHLLYETTYVVSNQGVEQDVVRCGVFIIKLSPKVSYFMSEITFLALEVSCVSKEYFNICSVFLSS